MRGVLSTVCALVFLIAPAAARENHALLIGASTYPSLDPGDWLVGPANDVDLVRTYLTSNPYAPFKPGNITVLADGLAGGTPPTLAAIRGAMADLAARVQPDDFVYLHFSGHGSQAPALHPDEELDGLDELFLPVDIGTWDDSIGTVENALVDDEIGQMIANLRAGGATVWAVFDSCYSGTITRAAPTGDDDVRLRKLAPETLGIPSDRMKITTRTVGTATPESPVDTVAAKGAFIAFYAAQTNETTPEKRLPRGMPGRRSQGVFTFTLFETLAARPGVTYRQLGQDILRRYAVNNLARATPLFEGDLDLPVFGTDGADPVRQWPLIIADGVASIPAGRLHGIEDGMKLALLASPADPNKAALGEMTVEISETFRAELAAATPIDDIPRGAWLRQLSDNTSFSLTVALPPPNSDVAKFATTAISAELTRGAFPERIKFTAPGAEADLRLAIRPDSAHPDALWVTPATGLLSESGFTLTPAITTADKSPDQLATALSETLTQIARVQNLLKLGGAFHGDALDVDIDLQTRSPSAPRLANLETVPVPTLVPDDEVHVLVRNHEAFPLDLNVLYIGADYSISHMFAGRLQPGDRLKQGLLRVTDTAFGRDSLVMILTPARKQSAVEDLSFLAQDELPATRAVGGADFAATLAEAGFGTTTRAATALTNPTANTPAPALLVFDINTRPKKLGRTNWSALLLFINTSGGGRRPGGRAPHLGRIAPQSDPVDARKRGAKPPNGSQNNPSISPASLMQMLSAAGLRGRPGMVMISPQTTTTNPAPALSRTSRTGSECPVGAPRRLGSVVKLY